MEITEIKEKLSILRVLNHYNINTDRHNQINCPFHEDDKPSMRIYPETNTYHCFGCGKTGDTIQFIQDKENIAKHPAIEKAKKLISHLPKPTQTGSVKAALKEDFSVLYAQLQESLRRSPKAKGYLKERGLENLKEVGYNSGTNWRKLKQCIVFPLKDKNDNIVSLYGRRAIEYNGKDKWQGSYNLEHGKHYYSENRKGLYPNYPPKETETLIITEAVIDAATLLQIPLITTQFTVLSAYGINGLTAEHKAAIKELKHLKEIVFFFDGDTAGREGIKKYTEELKELNSKITTVPTPDKEDVNSLYVNYREEAILQLIEERKEIGSFSSIEPSEASSRPQGVTKNTAVQTLATPLNFNTPNKIIYETDTARYIIKGNLPRQYDKMLVSLDVQHLETAIKYRCRLDLYEEKQTRKEARESAEKLDLRSDLIEKDLSELTDLLEEYRDSQSQQATEENSNDKIMDLPTQTQCKTFLQKDNLIQNLNQLIGKSGITGEANNRLFLFIIATSHKMPDTLHALIQGSSGSGKTHLLSKIAALMPPERVVKFTRVTENSFYNYDEFFFKNKLICLEDIDGLKEEALFAWRELISNNQLSSSTSQKDENGNIRSAQRIVRGPMASICATTHGHIYEDNMSRLFIIAVDESKEQTERIMQYQSKAAGGIIDREKENEAREFIQNCIRMLRTQKVINPYANKIKLPPQAHKIRRLHELFLSFVKQVTLINQYQRKRDNQNRLITEPEDLQTAVIIMFDSIFLKVDELDGSLRQFFESLKEYVLEKPNPKDYEFTQREVRHGLNLSKSQLQRHINELIDLEYLTVSGGYQNKGLKYKISYWDNVTKLREQIREYLLNQLNNLQNNNYN